MLKLPHGFLLLYDMRPFIISFNNMSKVQICENILWAIYCSTFVLCVLYPVCFDPVIKYVCDFVQTKIVFSCGFLFRMQPKVWY